MKFALIGDIHGYFDDFDVQYFNQSDYDCLLITGDIPDFFHINKNVYKKLYQLNKKTFLIYGNHDGFSFLEMASEIFRWESFRIKKIEKYKKRKRELLLDSENPLLKAGGYQIELLNSNIAIFLTRPHSIGGSFISYPLVLKEIYNVYDMDSSFLKMKSMLDEFFSKNSVQNLIILAHNGPKGLGNEPHNIWGCDFNPKIGDFGDSDLQKLIEYCELKKISIPFVVAGHMHHKLSKKAIKYNPEYRNTYRDFFTKKGDIYYFNPARVPRIFKKDGKFMHYHILVELNSSGKILSFEEKFV